MKLLCHCIDERNKFNVYEDEDSEYEDKKFNTERSVTLRRILKLFREIDVQMIKLIQNMEYKGTKT